MTKTKTSPYYARLINDLAVTFNFTPLTIKEVAAYWKRSSKDIQRVANELYKEGIVTFNKKGEVELTKTYKAFFRKKPELALSIAKQGF